MKLTIYSLNVRGLNDPAKVTRLRNYIQNLQPAPDILMLQEHKLTGEKAAILGRQLNPTYRYLFIAARPGYRNEDRANGAGRGGTATLIQNSLDRFIINSVSLYQGRALWIVLGNIAGYSWGFLNVYSPNDAQERTRFWESILDNLPPNCHWMVGGDFNMVESSVDKSTACGRLIQEPE
ncbi:hypothetical protein KC19_VG200300 [Ceratodon purpureus]|uniref:Endonuclease/exonuclease/phosphatase domain-containing protein n=1 Tax=Ceratodon purpureus TaxID=3225 RepID=A0A8T0HT14_CERPU|nr:hypothetical protein KC19_VG200300 [Ceratodon purpureus]